MNVSHVRALDIDVAPLNEQRRIVSKIESLFARSRRAKEALDAIPPLLDRLRQSILAAAFRGDLTADWRAQHPDVEPADKLLERIRTERRRRWEEAELEKMRAKGKEPKNDNWKAKYKEPVEAGRGMSSGSAKKTGELPSTWCSARLGELAELQPGYAFKSAWFAKDGVRLLRGTNIVPGATRWEDVVRLPESRRKEFERYELGEGDIVIAMDRPMVSSGLKTARLAVRDLPALLLQRVGRFNLFEPTDPRCFYWLLQSRHFIEHITDQATGTQLPHISGADIETAPVPLAPAAEQRVLAERAEAALRKVESLHQQLSIIGARSEALQASVLRAAFDGRLLRG